VQIVLDDQTHGKTARRTNNSEVANRMQRSSEQMLAGSGMTVIGVFSSVS
jgi:hypothetical protein